MSDSSFLVTPRIRNGLAARDGRRLASRPYRGSRAGGAPWGIRQHMGAVGVGERVRTQRQVGRTLCAMLPADGANCLGCRMPSKAINYWAG